MKYIFLLFYFFYSVNNCHCQKLTLAALDTVEFIYYNKSFTGRNDVICEFKEEIFWIHNVKRPLGLTYDSLLLLKIDKNGMAKVVQYLDADSKNSISAMTSLIVNERNLFLVDYLGVYKYELINGKYSYKGFNSVGDYFGRDNKEYGLFKMWHNTSEGVFTSDFQDSYQTVDGCSPMYIGHIDSKSGVLIDSFRHKVCAVYFTNHNAVYPIAVNESGTRYAIGDILSSNISLFDISNRKFDKISETKVSDSTWDLLNSDSLNHWWKVVESNADKNFDYIRKIGIERANCDYIKKIYFLNDSILFIYIGNTIDEGKSAYVKLLNINTNQIYSISANACNSWKHITLNSYSILSTKGILYVLFPNLEKSNKNWAEGKGWLLAKIRLEW